MLGGKPRPRLRSAEELLGFARDRSRAGRERLLAAVSDLFSETRTVLNEREHVLMTQILRTLVQEVETDIRERLADRLAGLDNAPRELIVHLAADDIEVAMPILLRSRLLRDEDLVEVVRHRTLQHQLAVAMRHAISETVSDALVDTGHAEVIETLLKNSSAQISESAMRRIVDDAETQSQWHAPLLDRRELEPALAAKLYWWVSAALRAHLLERFALDPTTLDDAIECTVHSALGVAGGPCGAADAIDWDDPAVSENAMVAALREGSVPAFETLLAQAVRLRPKLLRRIVYEPGGECLAIACRAIEMEQKIFSAIYRLVSEAHGKPPPESGDMIRLATFYLDLAPADARRAVAQWRRHPDYLAAIEQITGRTETAA